MDWLPLKERIAHILKFDNINIKTHDIFRIDKYIIDLSGTGLIEFVEAVNRDEESDIITEHDIILCKMREFFSSIGYKYSRFNIRRNISTDLDEIRMTFMKMEFMNSEYVEYIIEENYDNKI